MTPPPVRIEMVTQVHGTTVALGPFGVLIRGASGSGKSDLALRFLANEGWPTPDMRRALVADDQTCLTNEGGRLIVSAPPRIAGYLEVRGVGVVPVVPRSSAELRLVVDLVPASDVERLPDAEMTTTILGCVLPLRRLYPFEPSAPLKLALLLMEQSAQG